MPATLSGLQNAGGGSIAVSNALPNTPFLGGPGTGSAVGTGVGSLGEFGGYIPTPLPQFNNYTDYLNFMPGAPQMDAFASMPLAPDYFSFDTAQAHGLAQDVYASPYQSQAMRGSENAAQMMTGGSYVNQQIPEIVNVRDPNAPGGWRQETQMVDYPMWQAGAPGIIQKDWLPAAQQMYGYANQLGQQGQKMFGLEDPIIQAAFDPQNALYARTQQQLTDQTRAGLAARGLSMDPYGAGVEGQTLSNFNIDWQNNLLDRMTKGAGAVGGLANVGGNLMQGAGALNQGAVGIQDMAGNELAQFSQLPMHTWNDILQKQMDTNTWLANYGQAAAQPYQKAFQNWQDIQNQFLTANQQMFGQNQISGFEDPFALLQLQTQTEMEREQMNLQEQMMKEQMRNQMMMQGAQAGLSMLGGMGGK